MITSYVNGEGMLVFECSMTGSICYYNDDPDAPDCDLDPVYTMYSGMLKLNDDGLDLMSGDLTESASTSAVRSPSQGQVGIYNQYWTPTIVPLSTGIFGILMRSNEAQKLDMWRYNRATGWTFEAGGLDLDVLLHPMDVAAVNWQPDVEYRLDVFALGANRDLVHRWKSGGQWSSTWESLGGYFTGPPAATSRGIGHLDVIARNASNELWWKSYVSGAGWSNWVFLGGNVTSSPAVTAQGTNRLDVVFVDPSGNMMHRSYDARLNSWTPEWKNIGGPFSPAPAWESPLSGYTIPERPAIASVKNSRLTAFGGARNGNIWASEYSLGGGWSRWKNLGLAWVGGPSVVRTGGDEIAMVGLGPPDTWQYVQLDPVFIDVRGSIMSGAYISSCDACPAKPAIGREMDGRLHVIYANGNDILVDNWQVSNGWSGRNPVAGFDPAKARQSVVARRPDGRLEIFYIGMNDDVLYRKVQDYIGGPWTYSSEISPSYPKKVAKELAIGQGGFTGPFELFYIGIDDRIYHSMQQPDGLWSEHSLFVGPASYAKKLAVVANASGYIELFSIGLDNRVYNTRQLPQGGWSYNDPDVWPALAKQITLRNASDGSPELFFIGLDDHIHHWWKAFGTINEALPAGGDKAKEIAVAPNQDGRLEIFYVGLNSILYHSWQTWVGGPWSPGDLLGGATRAKQVVAERSGDGRIEVVYLDLSGAPYHTGQTTPGGSWGSKARLDDPATANFIPGAMAGIFRDQDWNYQGYEWDSGFTKGDCAEGWAQQGLSNQVGGQAHKVLCRYYSSLVFPGTYADALEVPGDDRRALRIVAANTDWAEGYWKLECGLNEYVSGSSLEGASGNYRFHGIKCATSYAIANESCNVRVFDYQDSRGESDSGEWDQSHYKGECRRNEYVAGVSVHPTTLQPHSLLCCGR